MAQEEKKLKITGVMCPKCKQVIFGRDEDGCTVVKDAEQEKQMGSGRYVCSTKGCGQKIELQGPGGYQGSHWVPVDEYTDR
jgi:hypothetical protein